MKESPKYDNFNASATRIYSNEIRLISLILQRLYRDTGWLRGGRRIETRFGRTCEYNIDNEERKHGEWKLWTRLLIYNVWACVLIGLMFV